MNASSDDDETFLFNLLTVIVMIVSGNGSGSKM
jgi:hypothetical protein